MSVLNACDAFGPHLYFINSESDPCVSIDPRPPSGTEQECNCNVEPPCLVDKPESLTHPNTHFARAIAHTSTHTYAPNCEPHLFACCERVFGVEGRVTHQALVHDNSQRPPIHLLAITVLLKNFRRDVVWRANRRAGLCVRRSLKTVWVARHARTNHSTHDNTIWSRGNFDIGNKSHLRPVAMSSGFLSPPGSLGGTRATF